MEVRKGNHEYVAMVRSLVVLLKIPNLKKTISGFIFIFLWHVKFISFGVGRECHSNWWTGNEVARD